MQTMTIFNPSSPLSVLSPSEKAEAFSVFRREGVDPARLFADLLRFVAITKKIPFAIGKGEDIAPALSVLDELGEWAEKERIIAKMEAETGCKLVRDTRLEQWLDEAVKHTVHPEIEAMTDDDLMSFVNAEVKQYRAEKRALEAIQASH